MPHAAAASPQRAQPRRRNATMSDYVLAIDDSATILKVIETGWPRLGTGP